MAHVNTVKVTNIGVFIIATLLSLPCLAIQKCELCPRDSIGRIQRSAMARNEFKRENPCPSTGDRRGSCPGYVIDHVVPLKRGGPDAPENMQWQTKEEAKAKDKWE